MTAENLIARSIETNSIVHAPRTDDIRDALIVVCDDHVENGPVEELWGTTDDGDEWRIHLRVQD